VINPVVTETPDTGVRLLVPRLASDGLSPGLTTNEVEARRRAGATNAAALPTALAERTRPEHRFWKGETAAA
jgi:hypothetical protein